MMGDACTWAGVCVFQHVGADRVGVWTGGVHLSPQLPPPPPPSTATDCVGTHSTGMYSCFVRIYIFIAEGSKTGHNTAL